METSSLSEFFFKLFIVGVLILMAPLLIWIAAVDRFGTGVNDTKITSILVFMTVIQLVFWKITESFFAAWTVNLLISIVAICFALFFGHTPIPVG